MKTPFPTIDPTRHVPFDVLDQRFGTLAPSPRDEGTVTLLVARELDRMRNTLANAHLDESGMPGDAWARDEDRHADAQLAVMNSRVGAVIANGQSITLFGDNLVLDLDLSEDNLPSGSRLQIGKAVVEVTPKAHTGCKNYAQRFGSEALRFISSPERRPLHLRGVYFRIVEAGDVAVGDVVKVLRRGP